MKEVFRSEVYRLSKAKEIWAMAICLVGVQVLTFVSYIVVSRTEMFGEYADDIYGNGFFNCLANGSNTVVYRVLFIIMLAALVTKLYQSGVMKQLVSSGISRKNMVLGQFAAFFFVFSLLAILSSVASGLESVLAGGSFTLVDASWGRLVLAFLGMLLVVANLTSIYLFVAHLTGSMGVSFIVGIAIEMGLPSAISGMSFYTGKQILADYSLDTLQGNVVALTTDLAITKQLTAFLILAAITVVLVVLNIMVIKRKEIK